VNCTTGNNRTGPFTGILLSLLHVPTEQIATEYALSNKGLTPIRPLVVARLVKNPKFAAAFGDDVEKRAMRMVSARPETMFTMLEMVNERWGSAEGYVRKECGLTDEEIERVRRVLTEEPVIEPVRDLANNHS
jgi:protein tyrosine/serine phosphatase